MKNLWLILLFLTGFNALLLAQKSAVIGTMVSRPNAILVLNPPDRNQGFLLPQLTTAERQSITPNAPADNGLIVFDTDEKSFYYWKEGAWVKGLGADAATQTLTFNPVTQTLSIGANTADLSSLKEIPAVAGNGGRFLKTDGTTLTWETIDSFGDITSITAGQGLTGGGITGDVGLAVNTDGNTISLSGGNALQLSDGAVTTSKIGVGAVNSTAIADGAVNTNDLANGAVGITKITPGANDQVLTTTPAGVVAWIDRSAFADDNQNLALAGNTLNIDGGTGVDLNDVTVAGGQIAGTLDALTIQTNAITDVHLADNAVDAAAIQVNAVESSELADNSVDAAAIQNGVVGITKITPGANDQVLTTTPGGAVAWVNRSTFNDDNQNLALVGNTLNIDGGTGVDLNDVTVAGGQIAGTLDALTIQTNAITDVQLGDNAVDAASIQTNAVTDGQLADNSVDAAAIQNGVVGITKITPGANDQVLTTTPGGAVAWVNRSTFNDDNQNLALVGNTLNIDGGTGVDLNDVTVAGGQIAGTLDALTIQTNAITDVQLGDNAVDAASIQTNAVTDSELADNAVDAAAIQNGVVGITKITPGANDQVLTTTPGGAVAWVNRSTFNDDNQNLALVGNTLNIDGGTGVDLNDVTVAGGQIAGTLDALTIQTNAITDVQLGDNAVDAASIQTNAVTDSELADNAVDAAAIQNGVVGITKITPGANDQVLTTTPGGAVAWVNRSTFNDDNQNLALAGNTLNIDGGTGVDLNDVTVAGGQIAGTLDALTIQTDAVTDVQLADNSVDAAAIQNGVVGITKITPGANDQVLTTTPGGAVAWVNRSTFNDDNQNLALAGNTLNIDGGTGVDLNDVSVAGGQIAGTLDALTIQTNAVTDSELADNAVDAAAIQNGVVGITKITPGANDQVLTTTPGGAVAWVNRSTFNDDNQNLALAGNTLNIDGGTGVDLNDVTVAGGQIAGTLDALTIQTNAITDVQLADNSVDAAAIQVNAVESSELADNAVDAAAIQNGVVGITKITPGANDQVLTTTPGGAVAWVNRSTFNDDNQNLSLTGNTLNIDGGTGTTLNGVTVTGDVTGTVNANTVTKIQGRDVSATAPNANDLLSWNGTSWVPRNVTVSPVTQYYAIDPSAFQGLEPSNGNNETVLGLYQDDNTFVTSNGDGRQIMAPVNLPHDAIIDRITVYYSDLAVLGDFTIALYRKSYTGGNEVLTTRSTLLVTLGIASFDLPTIPNATRTVNNALYSYRIHVTFTASHQGPGLLDQRLYGIKIEYTK